MAGIEPACLPLGDQDGRQLPYYTRISKPTAQGMWCGGAARCGQAFRLFSWAVWTGRFCAHAATCRSAYAGLPCGHGLGNTDRSDFHRLIRKVSAAFSASVFPCQFWKMNKPLPASMEYASKAAQAGFDPAPSVLRAHPAPYKNRPAFTHDNCCLSAENSGRAVTFSLFCGVSHYILRIPCCTHRRARTAAT